MRARLTLAHHLDRWEPRLRRLAEKLGWPQAWLQEFQTYLAQPRMTPEEMWVRYTLKRLDAEQRLKPVMTEAEALAFYTECDYMLWRNLVHRRHSAWRRVLWTMRGTHGALMEYGCGIAPVTTYCVRQKPQWQYHVVDLAAAPHFRYAQWRLRDVARAVAPYNVITALDVFEHLSDPLAAAKWLRTQLAPGGVLHWNFVGNPLRNDLDLATEAQREETCAYLYRELELVWERDGYRVSRRR